MAVAMVIMRALFKRLNLVLMKVNVFNRGMILYAILLKSASYTAHADDSDILDDKDFE